MPTPMWGTVTELKGSQYLGITVNTYDIPLCVLLESITERAINYIDDADLDENTYVPDLSLTRAILMQATYEWRRRNDLGLTSMTMPDGSINKFTVDGWLPEVKKIIDNYRRLNI
jgi:hypothetical protein